MVTPPPDSADRQAKCRTPHLETRPVRQSIRCDQGRQRVNAYTGSIPIPIAALGYLYRNGRSSPFYLAVRKANIIPLLLLALGGVSLSSSVFAQQQLGGIGIGGGGAKNLRLPLGDTSKPSAFLTIAEISLERRQLGPLRLGVLQKPVFKNVTVEIAGDPNNGEWQRDLGKFLAEEPIIASATFVGFCIQTADQKRIVKASQAWYSTESKSLIFRDLRVIMPNEPLRSFPRAELPFVKTSPAHLLLRHGNQEEKILLIPPKQ